MNSTMVYILCRDRISFLGEVLGSIIGQRGDFQIVVSDNSSTEEVKRFVGANYPGIKYVRRYPEVDAISHINLILTEVMSDYFMMFHDDDLMLPGCVETLVGILDGNPTVAAVAPNAYCLRVGRMGELFYSLPNGVNRMKATADLIAKRYLGLRGRAAPFPFYMYRTSMIKGMTLEAAQGGKYSDASFLATIAERFEVIWLSEPLAAYRFHQNQDSSRELITDRIRSAIYLSRFVAPEARKIYKQRYRFVYWLHWLGSAARNGEAKTHPNRFKLVLASTTRYAALHPVSAIGFLLKKSVSSLRRILNL